MVDLKSELFKQLKDEGIKKVPDVKKGCKTLLMQKGGTQIWMQRASLYDLVTLMRVVEVPSGLTIREYTNDFKYQDLVDALS